MDLSELGDDAAIRHPWETVRSEFFTSVIEDHVDVRRPLRVLDVGSGDAWFAQRLAPRLAAETEIICWDINYTDLDLEREAPGVTLVRDQPTGTFDLVLMMDVIEHVEHDSALVADASRNLAPGGILLVSVPAFQCLYSRHDSWLGHHRRYRPSRLRAVVPADLTVLERGPLFISLLVPRAAEVALERVRPTGGSETTGIGQWSGGPLLTWTVEAALRADATLGRALGRRVGFASGLSTWFVARRR